MEQVCINVKLHVQLMDMMDIMLIEQVDYVFKIVHILQQQVFNKFVKTKKVVETWNIAHTSNKWKMTQVNIYV